MSANPTRFDSRATTPDLGSPLQTGNRVLESIARQESLRALLAFSDLHEVIRNRRSAKGRDSEDLFETERFILDEVLQLVCNRLQAITGADGIVIALAEGPDLVCRAASDEFAVARGIHLTESDFLLACLKSGRTLRCDDCQTDARVQFDLSRAIKARSTVLIPLRGQRQQLGVLQVFSTQVRTFTDHDVRCFDLFAELVLSALKPEDQNRRVGWLSNIAEEVLHSKPALSPTSASETETSVKMGLAPSLSSPSSSPSNIANELSETLDANGLTNGPSSQSSPGVYRLSLPASSRPGLGVVLSLVAIAAVFSAGTWWFMQKKDSQNHGTTSPEKVAIANTALAPKPAPAPPLP